MKHYTNILLAVLLTANLSTAKTTTQAEYTFTIHIGAFVKAKITDFENIRPLGYLYTQKMNNLQKIYMGDYETERDAMKILNKIKVKGYPDAFVTRRSLEAGKTLPTIQLGSEKTGDIINWIDYAKAGPLQTFQDGNDIVIITGPFDNLEDAQNRINQLKTIGFNDASIQSINTNRLHKVTSFETGGSVNIPTQYETIVVPPAPKEEVLVAKGSTNTNTKKKSIPNFMIKKKAPKAKQDPREEPRPTTYGDVVIPKSPSPSDEKPTVKKEVAVAKEVAPKTEEKIFKEKTLAIPTISPKVKRTSVLKLQEVLKLKGNYKSSLDGLYGKGTNASYKDMMANDKELQKYKVLTKMYKENAEKLSSTQLIIYSMEDDVVGAVSKLKNQKSAISKAYQAYGIFALSGKNATTDKLMNEAIKESFSNNKMKNKAPFNYKAKYAYSDYGKLIKHLRYIHGASSEEIIVPCWLFQKHKKEAVKAFDPAKQLASADYTIQDCGNIMNWESLSLLETIMKEMTPDLSKAELQQLYEAQSKRASLMLAPKAQSVEDYKKIDNWNTNLWNGLTTWETADPLYAKFMTPLKVTYFQSWALLEDHFMNKGFKAKEARGLSLSVMQSIVDPYLSRYTKKS